MGNSSAATSVANYAVRLRHDTGHVNILVGNHVDVRSAVRAVLAAECAPVRSVVWVKRRPTCDYCDQPGTRYVRDSDDKNPLCRQCAVAHYDTPTGMRENTGLLGITRFETVEATEWKDQQMAASEDEHCPVHQGV